MIRGLCNKKKKLTRLNLIPILDAVFIFIFFLLMSAQFIDIYEINSQAPAVLTYDDQKQKDKKPPLNLVLEIRRRYIIVKTGLNENIYKRIARGPASYDFDKLRKTLMTLKSKHIDEESVIFRPSSSISYEDIIKIIDTVQALSKKEKPISGVNKLGNTVVTHKLFGKIIFETII